jgi:general secretion pathway protein A
VSQLFVLELWPRLLGQIGRHQPALMTPEVIAAIRDHAQGNPRTLMIMAGELLEVAAQREARQINETLFFENCVVLAVSETKTAIRRRR